MTVPLRKRFIAATVLILLAVPAIAGTLAEDAMEIARLIPAAPYTGHEVDMLAKMVWGEALGCAEEEQALCVWTAINRLEDGRFGDTIAEVLTATGQFTGYSHKNPVVADIRAVVKECLTAWMRKEPAPLLPPYAPKAPYLYFDGRGGHNWFRRTWRR